MSPLKVPSLQQLRRYAIARSLYKPTSLPRAIARLRFVQADLMRAPARAKDLILAHRVKDYCAGELERRYPRLAIEEGFFINYGFLPRETLALLHPRGAPPSYDAWDSKMHGRARPGGAGLCVPAWSHLSKGRAGAISDHGRIRRWGADLNVSNHLLEWSALSRFAARGAARGRHPGVRDSCAPDAR